LAVIVFGAVMFAKTFRLSDDGGADTADLPEWSAKSSDLAQLAPEVNVGDYFAIRLPKAFEWHQVDEGKEPDGRKYRAEVWKINGDDGRSPWIIVVGETETPSGDPKSKLKDGVTAAILRSQTAMSGTTAFPQSWDYGKANKLLAVRAEMFAGRSSDDRKVGVMYAFYTRSRLAYCVAYYSDEEDSKGLRDLARAALLTLRKR
jgi:hypothetical protein